MATGKFNNVNVMEKSKNNKQPKRTNIKTKKNPKKKTKTIIIGNGKIRAKQTLCSPTYMKRSNQRIILAK